MVTQVPAGRDGGTREVANGPAPPYLTKCHRAGPAGPVARRAGPAFAQDVRLRTTLSAPVSAARANTS